MAKKVPTRSVPTPTEATAAPVTKVRGKKKKNSDPVPRADGSKRTRLFLYFKPPTAMDLKRYCFETSQHLSDYVNHLVETEMKKASVRKIIAGK